MDDKHEGAVWRDRRGFGAVTTTAEHASVAVVGGVVSPAGADVAASVLGPQPAHEHLTEAVREHMRRIADGEDHGRPLPGARARMAAALFQITGWPVFNEEQEERAYVSRLWSEDWDCEEDAVYDDPR